MNRVVARYLPFLLLLGILGVGLGRNPLIFYSTSPQIVQKELNLRNKHLPVTRKIIPLTGKYQVFDVRKKRRLSKVNLPAMYRWGEPLLFRKTFPSLPPSNNHYLLHLDGVTGHCTVQVNGKTLYQGEKNFLPITIFVPGGLLQDSTNRLDVEIRPYQGRTGEVPLWIPVNLPAVNEGFPGLIYLEELPPLFISALQISGDTQNDSLFLQGRAEVRSSVPLPPQLNFTLLLTQNGNPVFRQTFSRNPDTTRTSLSVPFRVALPPLPAWSPEQPHQYRVQFQVWQNDTLQDEVQKNWALRTVEIQEHRFLLNGKPLYLNGINYVYQNVQGLRLFDVRLMRRDLQKIKEMGFNAVRVGFYPLPEPFYQLTDSLGLLCLQDMPFMRIKYALSRDSLMAERIKNYLEDFLRQAAGHPSLVGIGMHGFPREVQGSAASFLRELIHSIERRGMFAYLDFPFPEMLRSTSDQLQMLEVLSRNALLEELPLYFQKINHHNTVIFSGLSKAISYRVDTTAITHDLKQTAELFVRLKQRQFRKRLAGQFALTYSDYILETPSLQAGPQNRFRTNSLGLFTLKRRMKPEAQHILDMRPSELAQIHPTNEKKNFGTVIFILVGLINFLVFMVVYRGMYEFRQNVHRAIRRPHGFFSDLRERRIISYGENFYLMFTLALSGALIEEGIFFFFRNNLYADYFLSLIFPWEGIKYWLSYLIWKPILMLPLLTILNMSIFILLAVPIRAANLIVKERIRTRHALAVSAWSAAPFIILIPLGMFFYNLLIALNSYWILMFVLLYFHVWYFFRWINGTRVMMDVPYTRVFLFASGFVLLVVAGMVWYYQHHTQILDHIQFLIQLYRELS